MNGASFEERHLNLRLNLREDLSISRRGDFRNGFFLIEDRTNGKFYRLGEREWALISRLDGARTIGELVDQLRLDSHDSVTTTEALELCRWLLQAGLACDAQHRGSARQGRRQPPDSWFKRLSNPLFIQIPLGSPDALLTTSLPWLRWTLSRPAVIAWLLLNIAAIVCLTSHWDRLVEAVPAIVSRDNWLYLLAGWLFLKVVHELYHGLVCKKYGGTVTRWGMAFILFSPLAFVDVTSSWAFRSKWQRIATAAAGIYVELFVASLATFVWAFTSSGVANQLARNLMVMSSIATVLFNGNFLMRFDGYYILSDLVGVQNLYSLGQQQLRRWMRSCLLGRNDDGSMATDAGQVWIGLYGVATFVWRLLFYVGVVVAAMWMFEGAGVLLALFAVWIWGIRPAIRSIHYFARDPALSRRDRRRIGWVAAGLIGAITGIGCFPWPGGIGATGVVEYRPSAQVRIETPGFVKQIHVADNAWVQAGDRIVTLDNPELQQQVVDLGYQIGQAQVRERMLLKHGQVADAQIEAKRRASLEKQYQELDEQFARLTVRAEVTGHVVGRRLDSLLGQYLDIGFSVAEIGDEQQKVITAMVPQDDLKIFSAEVGQVARIRVRSVVSRSAGRLTDVNPRATRTLPHPALSAAQGGPLAVAIDAGGVGQPGAFIPKLIEPHFEATVALPEDLASHLRPGQLARIRIAAHGYTVAGRFVQWARRWLSDKVDIHWF